MNPDPSETCAGGGWGSTCPEPPTVFGLVSLCQAHGERVRAENLNLIREGAPGTVRTWQRAYQIAAAEPADFPVSKRHDSMVYFARLGSQVKIGYSTQITMRLRGLSLREEAVLLLLAGGRDLEDALHAKFATLRIGNTEWFELTDEITCFITSKTPEASLPDLV